MPKITYKEFNFRKKSLGMIEDANSIIAEYQRQGYDLTLRQLYYQFVSRDLLPNTKQSYDNLGSLVNDARLAGLIDWDAITDRTRELRSVAHWDTPESIIASAASSFRIDKWAEQPKRIEVWIEKDALVGVFERVCRTHDVGLFSCRGYVSQSEMWAASQRMIEYEMGLNENPPQETIILHFGDHDPSGIDMTRDIQDRLDLFGAQTQIKRMALNMAQIREYNPPPNPAKITDARFVGYQQIHGDESWELDALEPSVLASIVEAEILTHRDENEWQISHARERQHRKDLSEIAKNYDKLIEAL